MRLLLLLLLLLCLLLLGRDIHRRLNGSRVVLLRRHIGLRSPVRKLHALLLVATSHIGLVGMSVAFRTCWLAKYL